MGTSRNWNASTQEASLRLPVLRASGKSWSAKLIGIRCGPYEDEMVITSRVTPHIKYSRLPAQQRCNMYIRLRLHDILTLEAGTSIPMAVPRHLSV